MKFVDRVIQKLYVEPEQEPHPHFPFCSMTLTLTLTRWPWDKDLAYISWRYISVPEMKFVDQHFQKLQPEQSEQDTVRLTTDQTEHITSPHSRAATRFK